VKRTLMAVGIVALGLLSVSVPAQAVARPSAPPVAAARPQHFKLPSDVRQLCPAAKPGYMSCLALVRTNVPKGYRPYRGPYGRDGITPAGDESGGGWSPTNLQGAYNLSTASADDGKGETVALIDAYDDPNAESDLAAYRSEYDLPACTTANGCFEKLNEYGAEGDYPSPSGGWAGEESLDVDMVSAICPNCHIMLVEAASNSSHDLGQSVDTAVSNGAEFVSNSYGTTFLGEPYEDPTESEWDVDYDHPGVVITASAGDSGYGVEYPAASQYVTSVGGTSLLQAENSRNWSEIAWSGTGSGCSEYESKPYWQTDTGCSMRTDNDVSAVADPNTGVAIYDTYDPSADGLEDGWNIIGGTSVSSPIIASVYALAGTPAAGTYPASYPYTNSGDLYDITAGTNTPSGCSPNYLCIAGPGYDGPTGLGTPDGTGAFQVP
jgi:subtilase family serine protease